MFLRETLWIEIVGFEKRLSAAIEDDDGFGLHEGEELGEEVVEERLVDETVEEAAAERATGYLTHHEIGVGEEGKELGDRHEEGELVVEDLVATLCLDFAQTPEDAAVLRMGKEHGNLGNVVDNGIRTRCGLHEEVQQVQQQVLGRILRLQRLNADNDELLLDTMHVVGQSVQNDQNQLDAKLKARINAIHMRLTKLNA